MDAALGAPVARAVTLVAPLVVFVAAALTLAALVERSGLADRAASAARAEAASRYTQWCAR